MDNRGHADDAKHPDWCADGMCDNEFHREVTELFVPIKHETAPIALGLIRCDDPDVDDDPPAELALSLPDECETTLGPDDLDAFIEELQRRRAMMAP